MNLLLDTHVLLWWLADDSALGAEVRSAIADPESTVYVSAASAWEIAIKQALGRLDAPSDLDRVLEVSGFEELPITVRHALGAGWLPRHHTDPFDRMLVAQAILERLTLVTGDAQIAPYGVPMLAADR